MCFSRAAYHNDVGSAERPCEYRVKDISLIVHAIARAYAAIVLFSRPETGHVLQRGLRGIARHTIGHAGRKPFLFHCRSVVSCCNVVCSMVRTNQHQGQCRWVENKNATNLR